MWLWGLALNLELGALFQAVSQALLYVLGQVPSSLLPKFPLCKPGLTITWLAGCETISQVFM